MSSFNPDHKQSEMWSAESNKKPYEPPLHIDFRALTAQAWGALLCIWITKILVALMMGASFTEINPIAQSVYLADSIPLPSMFEDITMGAIINGALGLATVLIPTVIWKYVLSEEFQCNPRGYFLNQPIRTCVGMILLLLYLMLIALEIMALRARIHASLDTGPIQFVKEQPEALPMIIASTAMILGTFLLGLASAALSKSLSKRFGTTY